MDIPVWILFPVKPRGIKRKIYFSIDVRGVHRNRRNQEGQ